MPNLNFNLDQSEVDNESQNETCVPSQIVIQKFNQSDENLPSCSYNILNENNNRKRKKIGGILNYIKDSKSTQFASELTSIEIEIESYERHILVIDPKEQAATKELVALYFFEKFHKSYLLLSN